MADWSEHPAAKQWIDHVLTDMVPNMRDSAVVCPIVPDGEGDVKFWVELGAMIMLSKPIVIVAFDGRQIPDKLRLVAGEIVICPDGVDPASSQELADAIKRATGES